MTDEDIDTSDIPPLDEDFFAKAELRMPASDVSVVAVPIDAETLSWFQAKGQAAEQHMASALRIDAESQKSRSLTAAVAIAFSWARLSCLRDRPRNPGFFEKPGFSLKRIC